MNRFRVLCSALMCFGFCTGGLVVGCGSDGDVVSIPDEAGTDAPFDSGKDATADTSVAPDSAADAPVDAPVDATPDGALVADGGSPSDAGPGGTTSLLPCGSAQCAIPNQACCVFSNPSPPPDFFYGCYNGGCSVADAGPDAAGGGGVTALKCSGAANCAANTVCCVFENAAKQVASDCFATCGAGKAQLCDRNAAVTGCPADAGDAGACSSANVTDWGLPNGFATCGGVGN